MKILKSEIDWNKTINIQQNWKDFKKKSHILMMICKKQLNSQKRYQNSYFANKESEVIQNVHASNKHRKSAGKLLCA